MSSRTPSEAETVPAQGPWTTVLRCLALLLVGLGAPGLSTAALVALRGAEAVASAPAGKLVAARDQGVATTARLPRRQASALAVGHGPAPSGPHLATIPHSPPPPPIRDRSLGAGSDARPAPALRRGARQPTGPPPAQRAGA